MSANQNTVGLGIGAASYPNNGYVSASADFIPLDPIPESPPAGSLGLEDVIPPIIPQPVDSAELCMNCNLLAHNMRSMLRAKARADTEAVEMIQHIISATHLIRQSNDEYSRVIEEMSELQNRLRALRHNQYQLVATNTSVIFREGGRSVLSQLLDGRYITPRDIYESGLSHLMD